MPTQVFIRSLACLITVDAHEEIACLDLAVRAPDRAGHGRVRKRASGGWGEGEIEREKGERERERERDKKEGERKRENIV